MATTKKHKQVAPRISETDATRLEEQYRTLNQGAQESCHFWPLVRQAILRQFRRKATFTERETIALNALELPREVDKDMLIAILESKGMKCAGRVRSLTEAEAIVLVELIQNENVGAL